jgi:hypothetical protein
MNSLLCDHLLDARLAPRIPAYPLATELKRKLSKPEHHTEANFSGGIRESFEKLRVKIRINSIWVVSMLETEAHRAEFEIHHAIRSRWRRGSRVWRVTTVPIRSIA